MPANRSQYSNDIDVAYLPTRMHGRARAARGSGSLEHHGRNVGGGRGVEQHVATVDIQPPSDIYATFGRLNYKPWYALAEFVDNATQNFFTHASRIAELTGEDALLDIDISYDSNARVLTVADNAHGMDLAELTRAMKISAPPPDRSGRSEFGMRSEEHTSELQSLMRTSYAVCCLKKNRTNDKRHT